MEFRVGDKVVYPNQGVGIVEQISNRNLTGRPETFYLLRLTGKGLRVMVPMTNVASVGLRRVAKGREVGSVLEYLNTANIGLQQDWKGRFKQNLEKMRTGSLQNVAEVFKALLVLSQEKPLSFREKRMFDRAWQLLVDEIAEVRGITRESVETELVKALSKSNLKLALPS
jgi:CarD family transcriptional regulator